MFHYNSLNGLGYLIFTPLYFFFKAINHSDRVQYYSIYVPTKERVSLLESGVKVALMLGSDVFFSRVFPVWVFGTHKLDYIWDMVMKKMTFTLAIIIFS
jgi:hypothetical protein